MPSSAETGTPANVYNISGGQPFLRTLAAALLAGDLPRRGGDKPSPLSLSSYTLLLPTRRATRALQEAFLAEAGGRAMLLPKIRPIAEGQEDLSILAGIAAVDGDTLDIPPAISELSRRLTLTELVLAWSRQMRATEAAASDTALAALASAAGASTPAQAANLAKELAGLMDLVETEGVSLDGLKSLVPEDFSEHWGKTLEFLKIIIEIWPAFLAEQGRLSAVERRNRVLLAEAKRLEAIPPKGPVIIAGVTGSIPATARLMSVVARLPNGAIVLPDFNAHLPAAELDQIARDHPEHPQHGLAKLVAKLGVAPGQVQELRPAEPNPARAARRQFLSEMMRPAATTSAWHGYVATADKQVLTDGLAGMQRLEAANAQEEAEAIALIMREALETPGMTAALVSPDRLLARRVGVRLATWGINVDDSAGRPFAKTVPGAFLDLVLEAIAQDFAPAPTMALLKHPLARFGLPASQIRRAGRFLELTAFRTTYLGRGLDGIDAAVERAAREVNGDKAADEIGTRRPAAVRRLWDADWTAARDLVTRLRGAFAPWYAAVPPGEAQSLQTFAAAHLAVAEAIAKLPEDDAGKSPDAAEAATNPLWRGEAGEAAQTFFAAVLDPALRAPPLTPDDYPEFYRGLIANEAVRPRVPVHPRLSIWGPFEARLQQPDIVILGSLNEGTWPEVADPGPWLNRPMRKALGLPSPEERIGHAAHDFAALLGARRVYLTRALKVDGVPTVPSRWLMRIDALLSGLGIDRCMKTDEPWLSWARARENAGTPQPVKAPSPCPPVDLRPRKLSVTQIERWIANPYAIFAAHILKLEALPGLGDEPGPALRGAIIHGALGRFAVRNPSSLPADIYAELLADIRAVLQDFTGHPRVAAFWLPRFERFARWFADTEAERRSGVIRVVSEVSGKLVLPGPAGSFTLTARADRIDLRRDGATIIDYKTGTPPKTAQVEAGISPQLPLEAAILDATGFDTVEQVKAVGLAYVHVRGGHPPGEYLALKIDDVTGVANDARIGLEAIIERFDDAATPYRALRRARFAKTYEFDDYAHLARVGEWSAGGDDEGEG